MVLTTHDLVPYSYYDHSGMLTGSAVEVVRCVFGKLERPLDIRVVPWKRAQRLVQDHVADGFFAASQNDKRDRYATMSAIIAEQKWVWYHLKRKKIDPNAENFKSTYRVSSFLGANMHKFLEENDYNVYRNAPPVNSELLLRMLLSERIDVALANDQVMNELVSTFNVGHQLESTALRNKPLGVYFSKRFLLGNKKFLNSFNSHVASCRARIMVILSCPANCHQLLQ